MKKRKANGNDCFTGIAFRKGRGRRGDDPQEPTIDADRPKVRESQLIKCEQLRKLYNDAGVNIHIHKCPFGQTDDEIEFNFQIAKALVPNSLSSYN